MTFHVEKAGDAEYARFVDYYNSCGDKEKGRRKRRSKNVWVIKPGENSNRGCGITVT